MSSGPVRTRFSAAHVDAFLKEGWLVELPSDEIVIGWGPGRWVAAPDGVPALFAPDFYLAGEAPWLLSPYIDVVDRATLRAALPRVAEQGALAWVEGERGEFERAFGEVQRGFAERGLEKAVLVARDEARLTAPSLNVSALLQQALSAHPLLHPYGCWGGEWGMIGATPEVLFAEGEGGVIETHALAGTSSAPRLEDRLELLRDPKERREHALVVEFIAETLARWGEVSLGETTLRSTTLLSHLHTPITLFPRREPNFEEVARALHPTPALGVAPHELGFVEMRRWDSGERGRFGAPFGVTGEEVPSGCLVAIRNVQWSAGRAVVTAGCGVLPESSCEREWRENESKRRAIRQTLGL